MNKDQIIIDGVNLSNIRLYLETGHRSSVSTKEFEKIIDLLERKTQEYTDLKEDYNELEQRHNEAFQEFERLKKECEELKEKIEQAKDFNDKVLYGKDELYKNWREQLDKTNQLKKENEELKKKFQALHLINVQSLVKEVNRYNKALEEIENILASTSGKMRSKLYDYEQDAQILDIISKAKGI